MPIRHSDMSRNNSATGNLSILPDNTRSEQNSNNLATQLNMYTCDATHNNAHLSILPDSDVISTSRVTLCVLTMHSTGDGDQGESQSRDTREIPMMQARMAPRELRESDTSDSEGQSDSYEGIDHDLQKRTFSMMSARSSRDSDTPLLFRGGRDDSSSEATRNVRLQGSQLSSVSSTEGTNNNGSQSPELTSRKDPVHAGTDLDEVANKRTKSEGRNKIEAQSDQVNRQLQNIKESVDKGKHCLMINVAKADTNCVYHTLAWMAKIPIADDQALMDLKGMVYDYNKKHSSWVSRESMNAMRRSLKSQYEHETREEFINREYSTMHDLTLISNALRFDIRVTTNGGEYLWTYQRHRDDRRIMGQSGLDPLHHIMLTKCGMNTFHARAIIPAVRAVADDQNSHLKALKHLIRGKPLTNVVKEAKVDIIQQVPHSEKLHSRILEDMQLDATSSDINIITSKCLARTAVEIDPGENQWRYDMNFKIGYGTDVNPEHDVETLATVSHSVEVLDLNDSGNCVYHTMYYLATNQILQKSQLEGEKKKVREAAMKNRSNSNLKHFIMGGLELAADPDYWERYMLEDHHDIGTIAVYALVLEINIDIHMKEGYISIHHDDRFDEKSVFIHEQHLSSSYHLMGLTDAYANPEPLTNPYNVWEQVAWNRQPSDARATLWKVQRHDNSTQSPDEWPNQLHREDVGPKKWETMLRKRIGMYQAKTVTDETNKQRDIAGQSQLDKDLSSSKIDMKAHDPGSYGQAKTVYTLTNILRECMKQEKLVSSMSEADLAMYNLMLHTEDEIQMCKSDLLPEHIDEYREPPENVVWNARLEELGEAPQKIFLSLVDNNEGMDFQPMLSDSGASNTVYGKGRVATRLLEGYVVGFDSEQDGWVEASSMDLKSEESSKRKKKSIMVANGSTVDAVSAEKLHLGVKASEWNGKTWSEEKKTVLITVQDAAISENIASTVWSEGHFLKQNTKWTMLCNGTEKFMIYRKISMKVEGIDGQKPLKVDLREGEGGHCLDTYTVLTDTKQVMTRNKQDITEINQPVSATFQHDVQLEMVDVCDTSTDTTDFEPHDEYEVFNQHNSGTASDHVESRMTRWHDNMTIEKCLEKLREIMESPNSQEQEKLEAIEEVERRIQDLNKIKNYYSNAKSNLIQVNNIRTRAQRKESEKPSSEDGTESKSSLGNENIYSEYDKVYQAEGERRKRVQFEKTVLDKDNESRVATNRKPEVKESNKSNKESVTDNTEEKQPITEGYELFSSPKYIEKAQGDIQVYREDKFKEESKIEAVNDFTLASFLMDYKVQL